ncbi:MAG: hypothetical protein NZ839_04450, partial [Endomicrobia bacterium]|nr:hypothetical protein [Endomicrobiia bacterium]
MSLVYEVVSGVDLTLKTDSEVETFFAQTKNILHSLPENSTLQFLVKNTQNIQPKELNYVNVKDFVNKNQKTYFYPAVSVGKDVVVSVVSYTPYSAEEGILRFRISNNQKSFFFINLFQVETETNQKLPIKVF